MKARHGLIIVDILNGEVTIKCLQITPHGIELRSENLCYSPICLGEHEEHVVFGVVVGAVRKLKGK
jgi:SOS-response transcriptional repressor LexA